VKPHSVSVWDVAVITNCATVLRQALKQAPLERKWAILHRRLETLRNFKKEKDTGWDINQRINSVKCTTEETAEKLLAVRDKIGKRGFRTVATCCGAFVTFEEQPAAQACLTLFGGGVIAHAMQRKALRLGGRRLRAYPAAQPRDVLHANLPFRILALNCRGFTTLLRRLISTLCLLIFLAISFAAIIVVNAAKGAVRNPADIGLASLPASAATYVDTVFSTLASLVVVIVNQGIVFLVGALGVFNRHPTLSGMHRSKVVVIFVAVAFNTGLLPLLLLAAPPPSLYTGTYVSVRCNCTGIFCCEVGPKGFFARGALSDDPAATMATMSAAWHKDVGILLVSSLFIQAVSGLFVWIAPCATAILKRRCCAGGVMHRYDMEALYEGPEIDLPKFIGKAYAFFLLTLLYAAVLPVLYPIGVLFFAGTWAVERYSLLRVHRTPAPYSFELITKTLGWLPWAVVLHLGFAFWGLASLPAPPLGGGTWTRRAARGRIERP